MLLLCPLEKSWDREKFHFALFRIENDFVLEMEQENVEICERRLSTNGPSMPRYNMSIAQLRIVKNAAFAARSLALSLSIFSFVSIPIFVAQNRPANINTSEIQSRETADKRRHEMSIAASMPHRLSEPHFSSAISFRIHFSRPFIHSFIHPLGSSRVFMSSFVYCAHKLLSNFI